MDHAEQLAESWCLWAAVNQSSIAYAQALRRFGDAASTLKASPTQWQQAGLDARHVSRWQQAEQARRIRTGVEGLIARWQQGDFVVLQPGQAEYPRLLAEIADPPPFLWVQGAVEALSQPQVAVVGTRKPTASARQVTRRFARELAEAGLWVTSGLAYGIDAEAHQGALEQGQGRTVAVLGSGLDHLYPAAHRQLAERIVQGGGAVLSEFMPATKPQDYYFPRRNRVVSGLSLATLVTEGARGSGSLITATLAAEQGRLVFALPGHVDNPQAAGCHQLIREGAILVTAVAEVLEDINLPRSPVAMHLSQAVASGSTVQGDTDEDRVAVLSWSPQISASAELSLSELARQLLALLDWQGQAVDTLVEQMGLPVSELMGALLELELAGQVLQHNGLYQRCRQ